MNINELNNLASSIKNNEKNLESVTFEDVRKYCIEKYNESYDIVYGVKEFIEKNIDLFDNGKGGWFFRNKEYHTEYGIGHSNPYNCVIRDVGREAEGSGFRTYWVDDGIFFHINDGVVTYVSSMKKPSGHGYEPNIMMWNTDRDYDEMPYMAHFLGGNHRKEWGFVKVGEDGFKGINEFNAQATKDLVDKMFRMANELVEKLMFSIKAINDSVQKRVDGVMSVKDNSSIGKTTKYTIEVTKIEC